MRSKRGLPTKVPKRSNVPTEPPPSAAKRKRDPSLVSEKSSSEAQPAKRSRIDYPDELKDELAAQPVEEKTEKVPKKRKKKKRDPAYRKGSENKGTGTNPLGMFNVRKVTKVKKSTAMFSGSPFRSKNDGELKSKEELDIIEANLITLSAHSASYTPARKILDVSETGTPTRVASRDGTVYVLVKNQGALCHYLPESSDEEVKKDPEIKEINLTPDQRKAINQFIKPNTAVIKEVGAFIDTKLRARTKRELKESDARNQASIMVKEGHPVSEGSANKYGKQFDEALEYEWLHSIMFRILAYRSQVEGNLGCGTFDANTDMMFIEYQHPLLAKAYPEGYILFTRAHYFEDTQKLKNIEYDIITKDFKLSFNFNCLTDVRPDISQINYAKALVQTCILSKDQSTAFNSTVRTVKETAVHSPSRIIPKLSLKTSDHGDTTPKTSEEAKPSPTSILSPKPLALFHRNKKSREIENTDNKDDAKEKSKLVRKLHFRG